MKTKLLTSLTLLAGISANAMGQERRPNLVYIFPDQYRLHALSLWSDPAFRSVINTAGDPVHTPNLDRLAKQGMVFTQACSTCPISSPHRAMLITGAFPSKNNVDMNCYKGRTQGVPDSLICFTDVLAEAGYETAYIGKTHWHRTEALFDESDNYVGTNEEPGGHYVNFFDTYIPEGRGRKSNKYWFQQLNDNHFNAIAYSNRPELVGGKKDGEAYRPHRFTTEVEADIIIDYLENKDGQRDASKPFSLFWSINPPHPPYNKLSDCPEDVYNTYYKDLPKEELLLRPNVNFGKDTRIENLDRLMLNARIYFSLVTAFDREIGRVLATLEKEGLAENTILIFASDHGEMMGSQGAMGKGVIYDESLLIPYIIRWPRQIKPQINDLMLGATDIMPTVLGMMDLTDKLPDTVMGKDYSKGILYGDFSETPKPLSAFYFMPKQKGVRTDKYTYLVKMDGNYLLFDNQKDPYQMNPIQMENIPESDVSLLKTELGDWLKISEDDWAKERRNSDKINY